MFDWNGTYSQIENILNQKNRFIPKLFVKIHLKNKNMATQYQQKIIV